MNKKSVSLVIALLASAILLTSIIVISLSPERIVYRNGTIILSFSAASIHTTTKIYQNGKLIAYGYHAGTTTFLGKNVTMGKLTGNSTYNLTAYSFNLTYVSIGYNATAAILNTSCTVLPGEWNRTLAVFHDPTTTGFNLTAVFVGTTGSQSASCMGVNFEAGIGTNDLWGWDVMPLATGIDSTYTVDLEIGITLT